MEATTSRLLARVSSSSTSRAARSLQYVKRSAVSGAAASNRLMTTGVPRRLDHKYGPRAQAMPTTDFPRNIGQDLDVDPVPSTGQSAPKEIPEPLYTVRDEATDITLYVYPQTIALHAPTYGLEDPYHFDHVWLRDVCAEETSVESATQQKLFHTSDIHVPAPRDERGLLEQQHDKPARLLPSPEGELPVLEVRYDARYPVINAFSAAFSSAPPASRDPHISQIPLRSLLEHAVPDLYALSHGDIGSAARPWTAVDMTSFALSPRPPATKDVVRGEALDEDGALSRPARINWGSMLKMQDSISLPNVLNVDEYARFALVDGLMRDGLAFVTGVPTDKTGTAISADDPSSASLARLAEMLGEIRHTFYGSLWNVRSMGAASKNIAYTNLDLGLHMDLCYFQNPPRFQFLHMLRNRVKGGQSIFVDSFAVAEEMYTRHREAWKLLTQIPVCFQYRNDDRHYRYTHPTFELASLSSGHAGEPMPQSHMPRLTAVNYSPPFQGPLPLQLFGNAGDEAVEGTRATTQASPAKRADFYRALQLFAELTLEPRFRYERMLQEGECVVFDNRRVLHSRRGFEWDPAQEQQADGADSGVKRWLKGCYVDGDAIWSTYRTLLAKARGGKLGLF